jgi:hypothetical protein
MQLAGARVGVALIDGMTFGLTKLRLQDLYNKVSDVMGHAMSLLHRFLVSNLRLQSPSLSEVILSMVL